MDTSVEKPRDPFPFSSPWEHRTLKATTLSPGDWLSHLVAKVRLSEALAPPTLVLALPELSGETAHLCRPPRLLGGSW